MPVAFRPYQLAAQAAVRDGHALHLPGDPWPMVSCSTGCGKTEVALGLVLEALERGQRVLWLAHRGELVKDPVRRFQRYWPDLRSQAGIVMADRDEFGRAFVSASFATIKNEKRLGTLGRRDLIVVDEAHHSASRSYNATLAHLEAANPGAVFLGLTATPDRDDGVDLSDRWEIVYAYNITDAIGDGWLVRPWSVVKRLESLDLTKISGRRDYDDAELGRALLLAGIVEHTVACMRETHLATALPREDLTQTAYHQARGRKFLVFTATCEQARLTRDALEKDGWNVRYIDGEAGEDDRGRTLEAIRKGDVDGVCNAALYTEGTDIPIVSCLVVARPTKSRVLFQQMLGRGLRLWHPTLAECNAHDPAYQDGGKRECFVLDLAGATEDHSLIAAPVLIGAARCPKSPTGHVFEAVARSKGGVCTHCGKKVTCLLAAGGHEWGPDAHCKHCQSPQCEFAPNHAHVWQDTIEDEKPKRVCIYCGVEIPNPLGSLVGKRTRAADEPTAPATWLNLGLSPTTWAVNLEPHGTLFSIETPLGWQPCWVLPRGRKARRITPEPVAPERVRLIVDDLVRRASKVAGVHGGFTSGRAKDDGRARIADLAVRLGIASR